MRDDPRPSRRLARSQALTPFPTLERLLRPVLSDAIVYLERWVTALGVLGRDRWVTREVLQRDQRTLEELPTIAELLALAVTAGEGPVRGFTECQGLRDARHAQQESLPDVRDRPEPHARGALRRAARSCGVRRVC